MRKAAFTERAAADAPSSGTALEAVLRGVLRLAVQVSVETQRRRLFGQHALRRLAEQALRRAIQQTQPMFGIEREDGDVDLLHHLLEKRGGFERTQSLRAQRGAH